jgi:hypothetical protein
LKKLENDPRHQEDNQSLDYKFVPLADTAPEKSWANIILIAVAGGAVCGLVFFGGWWMFSKKNPQPPIAPLEISQQIPASQQVSPAASEMLPPPETTTPVKSTVSPNSVTVEATADPVSKPGSLALQEPDLQEITPEETSPVQAAVEPDNKTIYKDPRETIAPPVKKASPAVIRAQTSPPPEKAEIPLLKDPDMKLQALTWSREPHKRIAVVNNRILHEGESVSGYLLITINQDDVVFDREGKTWKLSFRTK